MFYLDFSSFSFIYTIFILSVTYLQIGKEAETTKKVEVPPKTDMTEKGKESDVDLSEPETKTEKQKELVDESGGYLGTLFLSLFFPSFFLSCIICLTGKI